MGPVRCRGGGRGVFSCFFALFLCGKAFALRRAPASGCAALPVRLTLGVLCAAPAPPALPPLDAKDDEGRSVLDYCMKYNKNPDVAKMLRARAIRRGAAQPWG